MPVTATTQQCAQGEAVEFVVTIVDTDGDPVTESILGDWQFSIIRDVAMQSPDIVKTGSDLDIDDSAKTITVTLSSEETYQMLGVYDFDLFRLVSGSESEHTRGKLEVLLAATKFDE